MQSWERGVVGVVLACVAGVGLLGCGVPSGGDGSGGGGGVENNGGGGGGGGGGATDCQERCVARASECGAPADQAAISCQQDYCAGSQTEAYVTCLEAVPCATVAEPEDLKASCGYTEPGGGGGGGGGGGQDCSGYPRCSGNAVETCEVVDGVTVTERSACGLNETCSDAECEQNACIESGRTGCNSGNNPSNCCDDRQRCTGNGNRAGETICCVPFNGECSEDSDCCNSDSVDNAWRCVNGTCSLF